MLESKPTGNDWYEAPENFDWQKSYCLTEGGKLLKGKLKSYEIQAKAAENILAAPKSINKKDAEIIEPLAKVRDILVIEIGKNNSGKSKKSKAIIKCEELEDLAKKKIEEVRDKEELQSLLNDFKQKMQES
ncbi:uncharacterized protein gp18 [Trichonephila inaurata madagascariensis]|uniref:Uncharacterized protein gp18 n=1 Tax=Trichonephila inaurata madagascariensis TaxID=2747483 RepID=A0A8X7BQV2_9ARAC|nr:uncharacterized protein gp18 [Trichonephila inaurata madagascariensis]